MTREEQIQKLIDEENGIDNYGSADYQVGVCDGVRLADANPKSPWISIDEDLPCNHEELIRFGFTNNVLVIDDQQNTFIAFMKKYKDNEWTWDSTNNFVFLPLITHWMPIPKLPKE